jgi:hypothetical protein
MEIFIGSSSENRSSTHDIQEIVQKIFPECKCLAWTDDKVFKPSEYTLESLIKCSKEVDCAIFIFDGDDTVENSKGKFKKTRDNVLIEYGLFVGALGRKNVAILYKEKTDMPSDLSGITYIAMDVKMHSKLQTWLNDFRESSDTETSISSFGMNRKEIDDYYRAVIKETRILPKNYTAYKLDRLITDYNGNSITPVVGESHWLMYKDGSFEKLFENDRVKFKIESIGKLQSYRQGEKSKNIFVKEVIRNPQY